MLYSDKRINDYHEAKRYVSKARNKEKGRPLGSAFRIIEDGDHVKIIHYTYPQGHQEYCRFTKGNLLRMTASLDYVSENRHSLCFNSRRYLPVDLERKDKTRYTLMLIPALQEAGVAGPAARAWINENKVFYAAGTEFDLDQNICLNPADDPKSPRLIDPDRRKVWLRDLRRTKRQLKAAIRVGAADHILEKGVRQRLVEFNERHRLSHWTDLMKDGTQTSELLGCVLCHTPVGWVETPGSGNFPPQEYVCWATTREHALMLVDGAFRRNSDALRREYGVFKEE